MAPRSKIAKLPVATKAWLDRALSDNNFADYDLLAAELKARGFDISKSAVHRYGQGFETRLSALRMATEQAKAIVQASPDDEGAVSEALMRLVQEKLFQALVDMQAGSATPISVTSAAKAVAELARATVTQKKWQSEVRAKAASAADAVDAIAKKGGLSKAALDKIRRGILGIAA